MHFPILVQQPLPSPSLPPPPAHLAPPPHPVCRLLGTDKVSWQGGGMLSFASPCGNPRICVPTKWLEQWDSWSNRNEKKKKKKNNNKEWKSEWRTIKALLSEINAMLFFSHLIVFEVVVFLIFAQLKHLDLTLRKNACYFILLFCPCKRKWVVYISRNKYWRATNLQHIHSFTQ